MTTQNDYTLRGVTVIDTRDGSAHPNLDVRISGGDIVSVSPAGSPETDAGTIVDATGKYLVPGYLDMHAHALNDADPEGAFQLMLAFGVTGFRQMSGSSELLKRRREGGLASSQGAPELVALCGDLLSPVNAATPEQAVATVRAEKAEGADFVKIAAVSPAAFTAAQAEARRLGIPLAGHLPAGSDPAVASQDGIRAIEHLGPGVVMLAACSTREAEIREALNSQPEIKLPPVKLPFMDKIFMKILRKIVINPVQRTSPANVELLQRAIDNFSAEKAEALAKRFVADGTWHVPTLIRERTSELCDAPEYRSDPNLRFVAASTVKEWTKAATTFAKFPNSSRETFRAEYALQLTLTKLFDAAGVGMLTGSDATGAAWVIPGASLHQEFDQLADAGLTPLRVLQMATLNAAEFLGRTDTMGTVEAGKVADLVVLDANPVESVDALHSISGVVRAGKYYSAGDVEALKDGVAAAKSIR
jgi:imidazolonepropionase-like amidohydrolase